MSQRIWIISDTHFFHSNIIKYTGRPFSSTEEMNALMIKNWNQTVKNEDYVYHLGDFALCGKEGIREIVSQLNGIKILIKGNHDGGSFKKYLDVGFDLVSPTPIILEGFYILSHEPVFLSPDMPYVNLHGHLHQLKMEDPRFLNMSVENWDYKPVNFNKIKEILAAKL